MKFEEIVGIYVASTNHKSKTRDTYSLKQLEPHFRGHNMVDLKRADVRSYITARSDNGAQLSTVKRELRFLSAAINFVRLEHDVHDLPNPVERLGIKADDARVRWITVEEATELVKAATLYARRPHLANFIRLALNTGCRKSELLTLEWAAMDWQRSVFMLRPDQTKNGKPRLVPLNALAIRALRDQRDWHRGHCRLSPWVFSNTNREHIKTFQNGFRAACERARIDDFRIHDLRHTFASWLVMNGTDLYVIKDLLGHSSITVTERYAHLAPDLGKSAVQALLEF